MIASIRHRTRQGLEYLALAFAAVGALGMTAIVGLVVSGVVMRKVANSPFYFTEEVVGLLMSTSLLLALPLVTLRSDHVRVTIVAANLSGRSRVWLAFLAAAVGLAFGIWLTAEAVPWLEFAMRFNLKTETSRILLYPWMALLPVSVVFMSIVFAARLVGLIPADGDDADAPGRQS